MNNLIYAPAKLTVELTPRTMWGKSLSSMLSVAEWDTIRHDVYAKSNHTCAFCQAQGDVRCHVQWSYDLGNHIQKLDGIVAVCPDCGLAKHYQAALNNGYSDKTQAHVMAVNQWSPEAVKQHIAEAVSVFDMLSGITWTVDASWLPANYTIGADSITRLNTGISLAEQKREARRVADETAKTRESVVYASLDDQLQKYYGSGSIPADVSAAAALKPKKARILAMHNLIESVLNDKPQDISEFCKHVQEKGIRVLPQVNAAGKVRGLGFYFSQEGWDASVRVSASLIDKALAWPILSKSLNFEPTRDVAVLQKLHCANAPLPLS